MAEDTSADKIALVAHDLRTPLAAMRITAALIGNGVLDARQRERLDILIRSIDALSDMTGDLIQSAHPGAARPAAETDAVRIVRDVGELFRQLAEDKGLTYTVTLAVDETPHITGDPTSVRRVFSALIDNAVKYTRAGRIEIDIRDRVSPKHGRQLFVSVSDTGAGISVLDQARLFRPFVRGESGRAAGDGSGLGLWGASRMVAEMNGEMTLESTEGGGSRFQVTLPMALSGRVDPKRSASGSAALQSGLHGHVLIVDDNDTNRRLLAALLESFGISSEQAESGDKALTRIAARRFDVVLLDLHMPGMTGLEVATAFGRRSDSFDIPLVAVTAAPETADRVALEQAGFLEILAKPLVPELLFETMARLLSAPRPAVAGD